LATVRLSKATLDAVKLDTEICEERTSCWVQLNQGALSDMAGNPVDATANTFSNVLIPSTFQEDTGNPILLTFTLDINNSKIMLSFDEPIDIDSLRPQQFGIHDSVSSETYRLAGTTANNIVTTGNGEVVEITIDFQDLLSIKALSNLAVNQGTTLITASDIPDVYVRDLAGARNPGVLVNFPITTLIGDQVSPTLSEMTFFDANTGIFRLIFDEGVDIASVEYTRFGFVDSRSVTAETYFLAFPMESVSYTVSAIPLKTVVEFQMSDEDLAQLKLATGLVVSASTTNIILEAGAVDDMAGQASIAVPVEAAIPMSTTLGYIPDLDPPHVTSFSLDMNAEILSLTFNEVIDVNTVVIAGNVKIQVSANVSTDDSLQYALQTTTARTLINRGYTLELRLSYEDVLGLQSRSSFATSAQDTYLVLFADFVEDVEGINVVAITNSEALLVANFTTDSTAPEMTSALLDLTASKITLNFNEAASL
jgi:hypothetical protein